METRVRGPILPILRPGFYPEIYLRMVKGGRSYSGNQYSPGNIPEAPSFGDTMDYLTEAGHPDVYLFTHKSAIPVADSVRGYYEERGLEIPELGIVNTKENSGSNSDSRLPSYAYDRVLEREVASLSPLVEGKKVAVVDQYIEYAHTIMKAVDITLQAGAASVVRPVKAEWYHEAKMSDIDFEHVSSIHAAKMREIGRAAAKFEPLPK